MKNILFLMLLVSFLFNTNILFSDDTEIGGFLKSDYRFLVDNDKSGVPFSDTFSNLHIKLHKDVSDNVAIEASGETRVYGITGVSTPADMSDPNKQYIIDPMLWEMYIDLYDLGIEGVDLRIGKQLIAWGKADRINPTANLNPDDFSDIFNFGEQIPSFATKLNYELNEEFAIELIWLPTMKPALMSRDTSIQMGGELEAVLAPYQEQLGSLPPGMGVADPLVRINTPEYDLRHSMQAVKIKGTLFDIDYSVSYLHGYDDIPAPEKVNISLSGDMSTVNTEIDMNFFEYHVLGMDFAGELAGMGWWIESALFLPVNGVSVAITVPDFTTGQSNTEDIEVFDDSPYVKATIGVDYTFSWSMYINLQYAHGLPMERGKEENINDYIFARIEQKFNNDKLKVIMNLAGGIMNKDDIENNYGYLVNPELKWFPYDSAELTLGAHIIGGEGNNFFTSLKSHDMVYLQAKVNF